MVNLWFYSSFVTFVALVVNLKNFAVSAGSAVKGIGDQHSRMRSMTAFWAAFSQSAAFGSLFSSRLTP